MTRSRQLKQCVVCVGLIVLLGAGQPPTAAPPAPTPPAPALPVPALEVPKLPTPGPDVTPPPSLSTPPPIPSVAPPAVFSPQPVRRFDFQVDPKATVKDLLPPAPKPAAITGPLLTDDPKKVPEVDFQAPPTPGGKDDPVAAAAHQIAKINHLNAKKTDAFMAALLENRPDLAGMPFAMGDDCRTDSDRHKYFTGAATTVRQALGGSQIALTNFQTGSTLNVGPSGGGAPPQPFWKTYPALCEMQDANARRDPEQAEHVTVARVAALMQMLAVEPVETRLGLVKYLASVSHVEATRGLARLAVFTAEDDVRAAALTALKVRREKDYTDVLLKGLRYPWPPVARRAADAIVKLERTDLIPELLAVLEADDPRMPATKGAGEKKGVVVRELVKVNHHRNCLLCHTPAGSGAPGVLTAEVAVQSQPLPSPGEGYRQSTPELLIRLDVTYLRQDFSAALPVKDAHPWPAAQRFDFFVRERTLREEEATSYRSQLTPKEVGVLSPYHKAAVAALRELTGKDTAPTAEAWRKLLGAPRRD